MTSPGPSPPDNAGEAAFSVAAVARRLGVAPATLRTWDRRYGLGPSTHSAGAHRRYTSVDIARLDRMRRLTLQGVAPSDAAAMAKSADLPSVAELATAAQQTKGRGGMVLSLADADGEARGLARAATSLDAPAASRIIREYTHKHGVVAAWEQLLVPVLVGLGERWEQTGTGVDAEHLLSEVVVGVFRPSVASQETPLNARPVLLACAEGEQHALAIHAVSAGLGERQIASRVLGPRVPAAALASAIRRSGPAAVFVWAQLRACANPAQLAQLPGTRPVYRLLVGGPGWVADELPSGVTLTRSLGDALDTMARAAIG